MAHTSQTRIHSQTVRSLSAITVWLVVSGCTCLAHADTEDAAPKDPFTEAKLLYASPDYAKALEQFIALAEKAEDNLQKAEFVLWQGHCHGKLGNTDSAREAYQSAHHLAEDSLIGIQALESLASVYLSLGDFERAEATFEKAVAAYPEIYDASLAAQSATNYSRNRAALDTAVNYVVTRLTTLANALEKGGQPQAAALAYRKLAITYPYRPTSSVHTLKAAHLLREVEAIAAAIPFYLRLLSASGDRAYAAKAVSSHNQPALDMVAKPTHFTTVTAAVTGLNACLPDRSRLADAELEQFSLRWHEALVTTFEPFGQSGEDAWAQVAEGVHTQPWQALTRLALAECYLRNGYYFEAIEVLTHISVPASAFPAVVQRQYHALSQAHLALADYQYVLQHGEHLFGPDPVTASEAMLDMAKAAEFCGELGEARRLYGRVTRDSKVDWHCRQADFALRRIAQYKPYRQKRGRIFVLPDDRTTRGDWYLGYGTRHYVLCAQNFLFDRAGGPGPKLEYKVHTTDPDEKSRLWVTAKEDPDPAALWDPVNRVYRPANRDDYGEQYPIAAGPDLLIDAQIPAGDHILSFYFVNDHNYYEPSREYTVALETAEETLAITDVAAFGGGVYKRFAVRGPLALTVHIWRNLSMNTLLSGMFLDSIEPLSPPPASVLAESADIPATLKAQLDLLRRASANDPVRAATYTQRFFEAEKALRRTIVQHPSSPLSSWALWTLSECYRLSGHQRAAQTAFASWLDDIGQASADTFIRTYAAAADELIRRRDWARIESFSDWLLEEGAQEYSERAKGLARIAFSMADTIKGAKPMLAADIVTQVQTKFPHLLYGLEAAQIAGDIYMSSGQTEAANKLLARASKAAPGDKRALWRHFAAQTQSSEPLPEIEQTYKRLLDLAGPESPTAANAAYLMARTYIQHGEKQEALECLDGYESIVGSTDASQRLREHCR